MITMNSDKIKNYESDLKTFAARAFPFVSKQTINKTAFTAQKFIKADIKKKFTLRNKFTVNSIQVRTAKGLNVNTQEAVVGSIAPYMDEQEFGGTKKKTGKHGVTIATTVASGEGRGAQPRRKKVPPSRVMGRLKLNNRNVKSRTRRQENAIKIQMAVAAKKKFVYMDLNKHSGIYRVTGSKANTKIDLIYDLSNKTVPIPRNPTFAPATERARKLIPFFYEDALVFQLKRQRLFK